MIVINIPAELIEAATPFVLLSLPFQKSLRKSVCFFVPVSMQPAYISVVFW